MGADSEFLGLPVPVWNLFATIALAVITGVYVAMTWRIAKGSQATAKAAVASLNIELEASFFPPMEEFAEAVQYGGIVQIRNRGATVHLQGAEVRKFFGRGSTDSDWKGTFPLHPIEESWGAPPWHLHSGEHRTFFWPLDKPHPVPGTVLVTIAVRYSIGAGGDVTTVGLPLDLSTLEET
jgi:hypothetical protein